MQDIARAFSEGGIYMFITLLAGLAHSIPILAQLVLVKKVDLTPYLWAGLAAILLLGAIGSGMGLSMAFAAVEQAQPEQKMALLARGISMCLNNSALAALLALPGFFFTGIASSLVRSLKPVRTRD